MGIQVQRNPAGRVRGLTPLVPKRPKHKKALQGRAKKRFLYNKRFSSSTPQFLLKRSLKLSKSPLKLTFWLHSIIDC
jgi:ribosomal protein S30